jgi:hypothetical protein
MVPGVGIDVNAATGIDARGLVETVALTGIEVVCAMRGGCVDGSGAGVGGDVRGQNAEDAAVEEGVLEGDAVKLRAFKTSDFQGQAEIASGDDGAGLDGEGYVIKVGMEGDGHGRGEGPGGGGPDDGRDVAAGKGGGNGLGRRGEAVADVDRWAGVHFVLDLGVGEGGTVVDAPVNGLEAAINKAFFEEAVEGFESASLVVAGHCFVGLIPTAETADAFELRGLEVNIFLRVGATCIQHRRYGHL